MNEFHYYYSDHSAFLPLPRTLKTNNSPSPTTLVQSDQRPVPLEFEYSTTQLQEKVAELNEQGRSTVYLVHFTQNACADTARDLLSTNFCTKEEKQAIARQVDPPEESTSSLLLVC